jgi:16S rRNA (guanine527-N7)-methyltransferase
MEKAKEKLELILKYFTGFTDNQVEQLAMLEPLYKDWNSKINVISRKDEDSLIEKHILHSLSIAAAFQFNAGMNVLDLGTGGGFPGIPLAIFFPEVQFHLVDSIGKKIKVVDAIAGNIGLKNVTTQHTRAEAITNRKFDVVVSRAVAPLGDLWKWWRPLHAKQRPKPRLLDDSTNQDTQLPVPRGLICLKGGDLAEEIANSGCRPRVMEVYEIFPEETFRGKYILYVSGET